MHVLRDVVEGHLLGDRRDALQACLAPVALHVVFARVAHAPEGLHRAVRGEERRLGRKVLRGVRRFTAFQSRVVPSPRVQRHHPRRLQLHARLRERMAHGLVGADRAVEHDALGRVPRRPVERDLADAARFGSEQHALGVQPVEDVAEALVLGADEPPSLDGEPVVGDLARGDRVAPDLGDRADVDVVAVEVGEEQAQSPQTAVRVTGAREQEHHLGLERLRSPDLATVDAPPAAAVRLGARADAPGVGPGVGLGHAERDVQLTRRRTREEGLLQPVVAELHDRVEPEDREVQRGTAVHGRSARSNIVQHDGGVGDAAPTTAEFLGDRDTHPATVGHRARRSPTGTRARGRSAPSSRRRTASTYSRTGGDQLLVVVEELVVPVARGRVVTAASQSSSPVLASRRPSARAPSSAVAFLAGAFFAGAFFFGLPDDHRVLERLQAV